ncbi:hypothetical protein Leryth_027301 [Lithospermum erythrorhizon]|nr:hypothetical protein Leryth_027301 [Lithospermum erythrorhizon]
MSYGSEISYDTILVLLSITILILATLLYIYCKEKPNAEQESLPTKLAASSFSLIDIHAATDSFNQRRVIGKGRLGIVYVAVMQPERDIVAVKRIHPRLVLSSNYPLLGFSSTVKWLSLADHPNVVPISGFCEAPGERLIVMEFLGMLSLDYYLHQSHENSSSSLLDWGQRLKIAAGAARGIEYLHENMAPNVIHGCVKPTNILIDINFCAKMSDYGLHFLAPQERQGMVGHVDDEYWLGKESASKESDVYGFGVVLLELLSGRRSDEGLIVKWGLPLIKEMRFSELLDQRIALPSETKPLVRLAKLALACVGNSRSNRPTICQVVTILENLEIEIIFSI